MERTRLDAAMLFREHAPIVARFLRGLGVRQQDCDDMVQDVFLVAHRRGGFTAEQAQPSTWLIGIALRVAFAAGRRRRRSRETFDTDSRLHKARKVLAGILAPGGEQ
jgi:RNA polymerase sigma-70 factor (ECF subfamily)